MSLDLNYSLGPIEVGILISSVLFGVTSVQVYLYYSHQTIPDPWRIRLLVPFIWVIEAFHTLSCWAYLYRLTVTYYGNPAFILQDSWELEVSAFFDGLVGALVQIFFAHRVRALSGTWSITIVSWIGSLAAFAVTTAIMILSLSVSIVEFNIKYKWLTTLGLALLLFVDIVNTTALCMYLRIGRTGFSSTDHMLDTLFIWTLETGLITSLAAVLMLIFSLALPSTTLWIGLSIFYAKLYSNSLMASLNGRTALRSVSQGTVEWSSGRSALSGGMVQFSNANSSHMHSSSMDVEMAHRQSTNPIGVKFDFDTSRGTAESSQTKLNKMPS